MNVKGVNPMRGAESHEKWPILKGYLDVSEHLRSLKFVRVLARTC